MNLAAGLGFEPRTIIDVGAARGEWTSAIAHVWPTSAFILVDPLSENEPALLRLCTGLSDAQYVIAAVSASRGSTAMNVHQDLDGSSFFMESEQDVNGVPRSVETVTVDDLVLATRCPGPFLLKADVQGAELLVLQGARTVLSSTEMVVLETVLPRIFGDESAQFHQVVEFMHNAGFVAWDMIDLGYRPLDGALCQLDVAFVRADGLLRRESGFATPTQRRAQIDALAKRNRSRLRSLTP
jgi:FkbM family methyltransferase